MTEAYILLDWQLDACVQAAEWSLRSPVPTVGAWAPSSHVDNEIQRVFSSKWVPPEQWDSLA